MRQGDIANVHAAYRRVVLRSSKTHEVFVYVARHPGANCIEIGLGFETRNGLQRRHVVSRQCHKFNVDDTADRIEMSSFSLETGKLSAHFNDNARILIDDEHAPSLAQAMRDVRTEVWGA